MYMIAVATTFLLWSLPKLPEVILLEDLIVSIALSLRQEMNNAFYHWDFRKYLMVIVGLWVVSIIGSWFNFLTLFYIGSWP
ncbi:reticulon-like protein B5 isoform X2 [Magnolia sinica]|uniref:reticulon-like protein B5 isoform X2 n=1 Tax=Magnolia sinica TaxID=86752 RepID=UPI0026595441|nr:reticulon-like protein B5 isoform X2 [Magnolia sinica]